MSQLYFDTSDFDKKFGELTKKAIPSLIEKGMGRAGLQLLNDCVNEVPTVPLKEGWLRGSGSVFVQNKLVAVSKAGKSGLANTDTAGESVGEEGISALVGFNAPYAAKMHEGISFKFTEPSSGPKYLEAKLIQNKDRYMLIVANAIKNSFNNLIGITEGEK